MQQYSRKQITDLKRRGVEIAEATKSKLLTLNIAKSKFLLIQTDEVTKTGQGIEQAEERLQ